MFQKNRCFHEETFIKLTIIFEDSSNILRGISLGKETADINPTCDLLILLIMGEMEKLILFKWPQMSYIKSQQSRGYLCSIIWGDMQLFWSKFV